MNITIETQIQMQLTLAATEPTVESQHRHAAAAIAWQQLQQAPERGVRGQWLSAGHERRWRTALDLTNAAFRGRPTTA